MSPRLTAVALALGALGAEAGPEAVGTTGASFLKIGSHARPAGLADSYVALAQGVAALGWNPAGVAEVGGPEAAFTYGLWFGELRYHHVGAAWSSAEGQGWGLQLTYLSAGTFQGYTVDGSGNPVEAASFGVSDLSGALTFALQPFGPRFGLGITGRWLNQQIADVGASALAVDVGLLWKGEDDTVTLGLSVLHAGPDYQLGASTLKLPLQGKFGIAVKTNDMITVVGGLDLPTDHAVRAHGGAEVVIEEVFMLRGGYSARLQDGEYTGSLVGWSAGLGVRVEGLLLDYAFVPYGNLGYTHRVSLGWNFGPPSEKSKKKPVNPIMSVPKKPTPVDDWRRRR